MEPKSMKRKLEEKFSNWMKIYSEKDQWHIKMDRDDFNYKDIVEGTGWHSNDDDILTSEKDCDEEAMLAEIEERENKLKKREASLKKEQEVFKKELAKLKAERDKIDADKAQIDKDKAEILDLLNQLEAKELQKPENQDVIELLS